MAAAVVVSLAAGPAASAGIVSAWGSNFGGSLGDGTTTERDAPVPVTGLSNVTAIAGGSAHSLALLANGTVMAWGDNSYGQLGTGGGIGNQPTPVAIGGLSNVTAIAAGYYHSLALLSNGKVMAWGDGVENQLGTGNGNSPTPVAVSGLSTAVAIAAGQYHSLALLSNGTVVAWGDNSYGQVGDGTDHTARPKPVAVTGLTGVIAISAGLDHSLALLSNGTVMGWGYNLFGQLGNTTLAFGQQSDSPVAVSGLSNVTGIAAGYFHSMALLANGTVMAWGRNDQGQLGDGTTLDPNAERYTPQPVSGLSGVTSISSGPSFGLALLSNHTVMSWGNNAYGELGDGTQNTRVAPVPAIGLFGVVALGPESQALHSLAIEGAFATTSSTALAFGPALVGSVSAQRSVTVTNTGPEPLTVSGESVTGAGAGAFHKTTTCIGLTLASGASCQISFTFAPAALGSDAATLTLASNSASIPAPVTLSGTGVAVLPSPRPPPRFGLALTNVAESNSAWFLDNSLARISSRRQPPVGTTFSLHLDRPAKVRFAFTKRITGRRARSRCVAATRANRRKPRCTLVVTRGTLSFHGHAGTNRVAFGGRISRATKLRPGYYTLVITATDSAGNRAKPHALTFTILKR
jgi:alpha-tubulin suppressor-like RCC1 family protein